MWVACGSHVGQWVKWVNRCDPFSILMHTINNHYLHLPYKSCRTNYNCMEFISRNIIPLVTNIISEVNIYRHTCTNTDTHTHIMDKTNFQKPDTLQCTLNFEQLNNIMVINNLIESHLTSTMTHLLHQKCHVSNEESF